MFTLQQKLWNENKQETMAYSQEKWTEIVPEKT